MGRGTLWVVGLSVWVWRAGSSSGVGNSRAFPGDEPRHGFPRGVIFIFIFIFFIHALFQAMNRVMVSREG